MDRKAFLKDEETKMQGFGLVLFVCLFVCLVFFFLVLGFLFCFVFLR